jgi:hypothetical protein
MGASLTGTSLSGVNLTGAPLGSNIHHVTLDNTQMLQSAEDLWYKQGNAAACVVLGIGSSAFARLVSQNTGATMNAAIQKLPWGFASTAGGPIQLQAWEALVWGSQSYCSFVVVAPTSATYAGVGGFIKALFRWNAPPSQSLNIQSMDGTSLPLANYTGMMDSARLVVAGTVPESNHIAGELAFATATTNNIHVYVDFASWVQKADKTGVMLGNVTVPGGPSYGEAVYMALQETDGSIRIAIRRLNANSITDSLADFGNVYSSWQLGTLANKPAPQRCAGALFINSINNAESDWQSKCDTGVTWAQQTAQTTGYQTWFAAGGTTTPYNTYMTIQGPATTPYVTCRPTDIVGGACPSTSLLPVLSETFVHLWEPRMAGPPPCPPSLWIPAVPTNKAVQLARFAVTTSPTAGAVTMPSNWGTARAGASPTLSYPDPSSASPACSGWPPATFSAARSRQTAPSGAGASPGMAASATAPTTRAWRLLR